MGSATTNAPVAGKRSRLVRFSTLECALVEHAVRLVHRRLPVVDAGRVEADRLWPGATPPATGLRRVQPGKCSLATPGYRVRPSQVSRRVGPEARVSGTNQDNRAGRDLAVRSFPRGEILGRHPIVGLIGARRRDVDDDGGADESIERNLIHRRMTLAKWTGASMCVPPCSEVEKLLAA